MIHFKHLKQKNELCLLREKEKGCLLFSLSLARDAPVAQEPLRSCGLQPLSAGHAATCQAEGTRDS